MSVNRKVTVPVGRERWASAVELMPRLSRLPPPPERVASFSSTARAGYNPSAIRPRPALEVSMTVHTDEKIEFLAKVPMFSACNQKELRKLAAAVDRVEVPKGEVLMTEGT